MFPVTNLDDENDEAVLADIKNDAVHANPVGKYSPAFLTLYLFEPFPWIGLLSQGEEFLFDPHENGTGNVLCTAKCMG